MNWAGDPLAGLDFETTGTDPELARIVTACVAVDRPGADGNVLTWLADAGGEDIPEEASAVHGITTEQAHRDGSLEYDVTCDIIKTLAGDFSGMPLVIFNAPYDATLLDRAARRYALDAAPALDRPVIDPLVLDKHLDRYRRGSRKLADVCRHYGVVLDNAHDAAADTLAAITLARELAKAYPEIARMTPAELHELQVKARADQAASFQAYLRGKGSDEVIDPSWPVIAWKGPEKPRTLPVPAARGRVVRAALELAGLHYAEEPDAAAFAAVSAQLARYARDLTAATDALPAEEQPSGWSAT